MEWGMPMKDVRIVTWPEAKGRRTVAGFLERPAFDPDAEAATRSDVINPNDMVWRQRWNRDNQPHKEISWNVDPSLDREIDP